MKPRDIYYLIFVHLINNVRECNYDRKIEYKIRANECTKLLEEFGFQVVFINRDDYIFGVEAIGNGCEFKWEVS